MRIGSNPEKFNNKLEIVNYHRVIVPVFIPHFEGYFAQGFEVFKMCIESLLVTVHDKTRITIYNNNCHADVENYINEIYRQTPLIDQVFHSKENLGKVNAILAAAKGNLEPFITITDADVLFKHGWQHAVEEVFVGFPEAGMVSPVPSSKAYSIHTANNWTYGLFKGKIFFDNVIDPEALQRFDASLGNPNKLYQPIHLQKYLVLRNNRQNCEAVMGCGHFVATLRREVFDKGSNQPAFVKIQGGVEGRFIDSPNERLGFLRLATKKNYAYHMGNTVESWMKEELAEVKKVEKVFSTFQYSTFPPVKKIPTNFLFRKIFEQVFSQAGRRSFILNKLGLNFKGEY